MMTTARGTRRRQAIGLIAAYAFVLQAWFATAGAAAALASHAPPPFGVADVVCTSEPAGEALNPSTDGQPRHDFLCGLLCSLVTAPGAAVEAAATALWPGVVDDAGPVPVEDVLTAARIWARAGLTRAPPFIA
jgi:hypothetical protein